MEKALTSHAFTLRVESHNLPAVCSSVLDSFALSSWSSSSCINSCVYIVGKGEDCMPLKRSSLEPILVPSSFCRPGFCHNLIVLQGLRFVSTYTNFFINTRTIELFVVDETKQLPARKLSDLLQTQ